MATTGTDVPLGTALAIGLGAAKATDAIKKILEGAGLDKIPHSAKSIIATGIAVGASAWFEREPRRRILTAAAATGMASLLHTVERAQRSTGDVNKLVFLTEGARRIPTSRR